MASWRLPGSHFQVRAPHTPNISVSPILLLLDDFRRHPVGCASQGVALSQRLQAHQPFGFSEVRQFADSIVIQQNVGAFDVSVYNLVRVEVQEPFAYVFGVYPSQAFIEFPVAG